jgi:CubicO group peptidase (beta-lactamase class C family)
LSGQALGRFGRGFVGALRAVLSVFACALPLAVAAQEPQRVAQDPAGTNLDIEELEAEIQEILDDNGIPGASVALVNRNRTIWAGGVGKADLAAGVDATEDHLFRIGSISKSFTALAVLHAVEGGLLDLDTPVRELAPEVAFTNPWERTHPVTVAMVMEHTAGFDDIHFREYAKVDDPDMTLAEGLAYNPGSRVSRWRPGTHLSYANSGPAIAAYIVERLAGKTFEDYVREHVFDPLGMERSTFHYPRDAALLAKGYEADGASEAGYDHIIVRPSGGMNGSSREMARYLRMMINRGTLDGVRLLAPETITRMETPTTTLAARAGATYGYGLGNFTSLVNGHLFHGHNGGITGFMSTSAYSSDLGVGFFVSINKPSGAIRGIATLLGERLTDGFGKPPGAVAALTDDALHAMTGWYRNVTPRQQLGYVISRFFDLRHVTVEAGTLFIAALGGERRELVPVTATSFRYEDQPVATVFRVVDDDGNPILQGEPAGNYEKVSGAGLIFQLAVAATTLVLLLSAVFLAPVWALVKVLGGMQTVPLPTLLFPFLAALSLVVSCVLPFVLISDAVQDLGTLSGASLTIFVGSLVFAALTVLSLLAAFRSYPVKTSRLARLDAQLVSLACTVALIYLWSNGLIGLRTWAY